MNWTTTAKKRFLSKAKQNEARMTASSKLAKLYNHSQSHSHDNNGAAVIGDGVGPFQKNNLSSRSSNAPSGYPPLSNHTSGITGINSNTNSNTEYQASSSIHNPLTAFVAYSSVNAGDSNYGKNGGRNSSYHGNTGKDTVRQKKKMKMSRDAIMLGATSIVEPAATARNESHDAINPNSSRSSSSSGTNHHHHPRRRALRDDVGKTEAASSAVQSTTATVTPSNATISPYDPLLQLELSVSRSKYRI